MRIEVDCTWQGKTIKPFWRECVGGGRVAEALRADFQNHLEMVQREFPFRYIRMHGLFHEDMMVYREENGSAILNWQYVDLVYDHWLSIGIRPFVELGFMPYDMASGDQTCFWWKGNVTPPRDWALWERLVEAFVRHVIDHYGRDEVRRWYFEVWNEPNLAYFWKEADFAAYMQLYERSVRAIKRVDPALRVGGPATTGSGANPGRPSWGREFLEACVRGQLPVDFFSTHPYPTLHPVDVDNRGFMKWDEPDRLNRDLQGAADVLARSTYAGAERHYTEWSSSPSPRDKCHDTAFMAPFIVRSNWMARGLADSLSFWVVSDIFEEGRIGDGPFHGGFGLINIQGLKKPSYHGYWFLSRMGPTELAGGDSYAVTRHDDGRVVILTWNYCHYTTEGNDSRRFAAATGTGVYDLFEQKSDREFECVLKGLGSAARVEVTRFDRASGSVFDAWVGMGSPKHLLREDAAALRRAAELAVTVTRQESCDGVLTLKHAVPAHGVTLVEVTGL